MSSDYRPRGGSGGSSGSSSGGAGGRRRRGGRGRGPRPGGSSESRSYTNGHGTSSTSSAPKKEKSLFGKLFGWLSGKKKSEPSAPARSSLPRPEFKEREPRAERPDRPERPPREDRPPKADLPPQEIVSPKLYVGNLSYDAAESELFDLFSKVGAVKNVEVAMDRHSNRSKGFGFVEMESLDSAKAAAEKLNRTDFMGRQIVVSGAKVDKRVNPRETEADSTSREQGSSPDATA